MSQPRIGELLRRTVGISAHDVDEILHEQVSSRKRFGEIALSWGLCRPEHIWQAWSHQLRQRRQYVSLSEIGVDAQAVTHLPREIARQYHVVPIRFYEQRLIVAIAEPFLERARAELPGLLGRRIDFVLADALEVQQALDDYYPRLQNIA